MFSLKIVALLLRKSDKIPKRFSGDKSKVTSRCCAFCVQELEDQMLKGLKHQEQQSASRNNHAMWTGEIVVENG